MSSITRVTWTKHCATTTIDLITTGQIAYTVLGRKAQNREEMGYTLTARRYLLKRKKFAEELNCLCVWSQAHGRGLVLQQTASYKVWEMTSEYCRKGSGWVFNPSRPSSLGAWWLEKNAKGEMGNSVGNEFELIFGIPEKGRLALPSGTVLNSQGAIKGWGLYPARSG